MFKKSNLRSAILGISLILVLALFGASSVSGAAQVITLKLHHTMSTTHPYHIGSEKFAELIYQKSNGTLKVEIFPTGQLGEDEKVLELLKVGAVAFANGIPVGKLASFVPEMNLFNFPFLFESTKQMRDFAEGSIGEEVMKAVEKYRFKGLAFHSFVFRYPMNSKRSLRMLDDFKGLKIRTMGVPLHIDAYRALGASPTPMPWGELYTGLQMGVVDGCENDIATLYTQKFYEVQKYLSLIPIVPTLSTLLMSLQIWNSLSPEHQRVIMESLPPAMEVLNREYDKLMEDALERMRKAGLVITEIPTDLSPFITAVKGVYDKYLPTLPSAAQNAVREIRKMRK